MMSFNLQNIYSILKIVKKNIYVNIKRMSQIIICYAEICNNNRKM